MSKTEYHIDATALKHSACIHYLRRLVMDGYKMNNTGIAAKYGVAFHRYAELRYSKRTSEDAIDIATKLLPQDDDWRNSAHLVSTCLQFEDFIEKDPFDPIRLTSEASSVECKFKYMPCFEDDKYRVTLFGVIDALGFIGYQPTIRDYKVTAAYDKKEFFDRELRSPQHYVYKTVIAQLAEDCPESFGKFIDAQTQLVGIFITKSGKVTIETSEFLIDQEQLDIFWSELLILINNMLYSKATVYNGLVSNICSGRFDLCPLFHVCSAPKKEQEALLSYMFAKKPHHPDTVYED